MNSKENKIKTIVKRNIESPAAVVSSLKAYQVLKISVVKVFTPKYFTAPYSFKTSIDTKKIAEIIAGADNGITTFKKVSIQLFPKVFERFKKLFPTKVKEILDAA